MCVWWRAGAGSPRLAKGPILCVLSLSMFFMGAGLWGGAMAVPGRRPTLPCSGGSQVTAGEDRPAHLHVPSMGAPRWDVSSRHSQNVLLFFGFKLFYLTTCTVTSSFKASCLKTRVIKVP